MAFRIQIRRDTAQKWSINNPILLDGEMGYETDTTYMKIGDGATPWNDLAYWQGGLTGANLAVRSNSVIVQNPTSNLNFSNDFVVVSGSNYTATIGLSSEIGGSPINIFNNGVVGVTGATGINFVGPSGSVSFSGKEATVNILGPYVPYFSVTLLLSAGNFSAFTSSQGPDGNALDGSPWNFTWSNAGNNITVTHNLGLKPIGLSTNGKNSSSIFIKSPVGTSNAQFSLSSDASYNSFTVYQVNSTNTGADSANTVEIVWSFASSY